MKTLLVPTDFSLNADKALAFAIGMAKQGDFQLLLFHAYHIPFAGPFISALAIENELEAAQEEAEKKLRGLCAEVILGHKVKCEYAAAHALPVDAILEASKKHHAALIVMGTKGATGLKRILVGSITADVVEKSFCPVLAVPEKASFHGLKKIVYATDYHHSDLESLKTVLEIAGYFNSDVDIVHVCDGEYTEESEKGLLKKFEGEVRSLTPYPRLSFNLCKGKNIQDKLRKYSRSRTTDLLVMSTRHRTVTDKLFNRSMTKKMAYHTRIPLLSFHYTKEQVVLI